MATLKRGSSARSRVASCSTDDGTGRRRPAHRLTPRHVLLLSDAGPVVAGSTHGGLLGRALVIICFALVRAARRAPGRAPFPAFLRILRLPRALPLLAAMLLAVRAARARRRRPRRARARRRARERRDARARGEAPPEDALRARRP